MREIIADGGLWLAVLVSLAAGALSFFSPCVLPLVPGYLAYVGGVADVSKKENRRKTLPGILLFIAGFTAVFVSFITLTGTFAVWVAQWEKTITQVMGVLIIIMGVVFIGGLKPAQTTKRLKFKPNIGLFGAPLLGATFAVGWTPCIGPTLALIMSLSLQQASVWRGAVLGIAYCLGLGLPFVFIALGLGWMTRGVSFIKRHIRAVNIAGGALLIIIGGLMATGLWTQLIYSLQSTVGGFVTPL